MSEKNDKIQNALEKYPDDVFLYYGEISREGYRRLSSAIESRIEKKEKAEKACLILVTLGGNAHAAFRIARALRHHYRFLDIFIPDICKSAGTLICIAANRLIFGDRGELGPLDVQIFKPDELSEVMSGLDLSQALIALHDQILESFRIFLGDIYTRTRLGTKSSAELATELAKGFIAPIVGKIDPVTLGKHQRALQIAHDYGLRLNKMCGSLKTEDALDSLVRDYPSHGFVIDRREARERLFKNVESPAENMVLLYEWVRAKLIPPEQLIYDPPLVKDLKREQSKQEKDSDESQPSQENVQSSQPSQKTQRSGKSSQSGQKNVESSQPSQKTQRSGKSSQPSQKTDAAEVEEEVDQSE